MKKRLLALALCLVMMTSLLPITAAADTYNIKSVDRQESGVIFSEEHGCYRLEFEDIHIVCDSGELSSSFYLASYAVHIYTDKDCRIPCTEAPTDGTTLFFKDIIPFMTPISLGDDFQAKVLVPGYETEFLSSSYNSNSRFLQINFSLTKKHEHAWQFTQTENTLTAECQNQECRKEVSVSLKADSVTLPTSPFNAQVILNGITEEEIKKEFRYLISPIRYKFKAPGDSAFTEITPADGAREGTYQAAVTLSPIEVAARYARNDDGTTQGLVTEPDGSITLYTQYTAVNPETTAQTGDDRPIELMMGSVVAFSALAAAAFILDSKRRSQQ